MRLCKAVVVTLAFMSLDVGMTTAIYILSHLDRSLLEDIRHFNIFDSVLDLWAACVYRSCLLLGATIGVAKNSTLGPRRLRASWTVIALVCLFGGIYTMVKLLLFSEVRKPVRDPWFWALFVWTYISLAASFLLWWLLVIFLSSRNTDLLEPNEWTQGCRASSSVWREDSGLLSRTGRKRRPHLAMTGASHGFPQAVAPVGVFSRGTTRTSGSLSCGARELMSPCAWRGGAGHHSRVMGSD